MTLGLVKNAIGFLLMMVNKGKMAECADLTLRFMKSTRTKTMVIY